MSPAPRPNAAACERTQPSATVLASAFDAPVRKPLARPTAFTPPVRSSTVRMARLPSEARRSACARLSERDTGAATVRGPTFVRVGLASFAAAWRPDAPGGPDAAAAAPAAETATITVATAPARFPLIPLPSDSRLSGGGKVLLAHAWCDTAVIWRTALLMAHSCRARGAAAIREDVVECAAEPERERSGEDRRVAQAGDLDARRGRAALGEQLADRAQEQGAVGADPASEHHQADVRDRGDRDDVLGDALHLAGDDLERERVAAARRGEDLTGVERRAQRRLQPALRGEPRGERRHADGRRVVLALEVAAEREVHLAGGPVMAPVQLAPQHEPGAEAGSDREEHEVLHPLPHAAPVLADGRQVDVVVDRHRHTQGLLERGPDPHPLQPRDVPREPDRSGRFLDHARHPSDDAVERMGRQAAGDEQPVAQVTDAVEHRPHAGAGHLDVLARADGAAQVADGRAQEAGAEVQAEHERRLVDRLEERRAVLGADRRVDRLAHEPGFEQRAERDRDGRLRDPRAPRDLRAGDRRAGADRLEHGALVEVAQHRRRGWCAHAQILSPVSASKTCGSWSGLGRRCTRVPRSGALRASTRAASRTEVPSISAAQYRNASAPSSSTASTAAGTPSDASSIASGRTPTTTLVRPSTRAGTASGLPPNETLPFSASAIRQRFIAGEPTKAATNVF